MSAKRPKSEADALLWTTAEHALSIETPWHLLEEINGVVIEGLRRLSRGGVEVGGILFGRRTGSLLRILAWRPIVCEHSRGPAFLLSNSDKQALLEQLERAESDPQLQVLEPLGWFVSHTRVGVAMTDEDLQIFNRYFPEPWQVTLVIHPARNAPSRAGFFVRSAPGPLRTEASAQEFTISGSRPTVSSDGSLPTRNIPLTPDSPPSPAPVASGAGTPWRALAVAAALSLFALALLAVPRLRSSASPSSSLQLRLEEANGQLRIQWDPNHPAVREADSATVVIQDAGTSVPVTLDAAALRGGSLNYLRLSEDVRVRLMLQKKGKTSSQELARYVGSPVPDPGAREIREARDSRERYLKEARTLREQLKTEIERTRQLERAVRKLELEIQREQR